ncbi:site-2 protease family protein [Paenibacillus arenosi]|uniref:Peptidase M50 domain-containing protein n=1 Tax=Paenibacillus arenosi TaxID=2774142 RepID=A0ABR9B485_9BACL|nr:site-2 protease family protein [Paenibacillus arenosi]MBD8501197.1 hypothetical protein [Paenibacillus arenosi]
MTTIFAAIAILKYISACIHEFGHFLVAKLAGFDVEEVIIGENVNRQVINFNFFGTPFCSDIGAGGITSVKLRDNNFIKLRLLAFVLGGVILQFLVSCMVWVAFGMGNEQMYFLPLLFGVINLWSIIRCMLPKEYYFNGTLHLSDGLRMIQVIKMRINESE